MNPENDILHDSKIEMAISELTILKPSRRFRRFLSKANHSSGFLKRFRAVVIAEELVTALKKGSFTKPLDLVVDDDFFQLSQEPKPILVLFEELFRIVLKNRIKEIRLRVCHKHFTDVIAHARLKQKYENEYKICITFKGEPARKDQMKISKALEIVFAEKDFKMKKKLKHRNSSHSLTDGGATNIGFHADALDYSIPGYCVHPGLFSSDRKKFYGKGIRVLFLLWFFKGIYRSWCRLFKN